MFNKVPRYYILVKAKSILKIKIEDIQYYGMEQILKPYFSKKQNSTQGDSPDQFKKAWV